MSNYGRYGFLPWARRGLGRKIAQTDNLGLPPDTSDIGRPKISVKLQFNSQEISREIEVIGPGDILGIHNDVVVRTEPARHVSDFEANYLPCIEFYEEDFPWLYTPAVANGNKLRPWLALIALKDDEFISLPGAGHLSPAIQITGDFGKIFHPHADHWAWAHVHVQQPNSTPVVGETTEEGVLLANLKQDLEINPDVAISRLLCTRKLAPGTQYTCFLIPAFEAGRLAGLGEDVDSVPSLRPSWDLATTPSDPQRRFPVYYQWRFGTGSLGDFETLARALRPVVAPASHGGRLMDITHTGPGIDAVFFATNPGVPATVMLEGAVQPPAFTSAASQDVAAISDSGNLLAPYTSAVAEIMNTAYDLKTSGAASSDPIISPPIYGQWHAGTDHIDTTNASASPLWLQELNLDARSRAAAGLGAQVIRDNQEHFMEVAWHQIGEVLAVNDRINKSIFAIEASRVVYTKHFIADTQVASGYPTPIFEQAVRLGGAALKKINMGTGTSAVTVKRLASLSTLTRASIDSGFRKLTRNRSEKIKVVGPEVVNAQLVSRINNNQIVASQPHRPVVAALNTTDIALNFGSMAGGLSYSDGPGMILYDYYHWKQMFLGQYSVFVESLEYYDQLENVNNPPLPSLDAADFGEAVESALNPSTALTERVIQQIQNEVYEFDGVYENIDSVKPIMAYPVIDEPMFSRLINISPDYLLPNVADVLNNTVSVFKANNRFIQAFMAGLNHEFSRELLWREYPTDQRGSYFRRFWDITDTISTSPDSYNDIKPMHAWDNSLGNNTNSTAVTASGFLFLVIRGDLLKKYPDSLIYATKAKFEGSGTVVRRIKNLNIDTNNKYPIFKATLKPDVVVLGFDIDPMVAKGTWLNPGWFFVFQERPGHLRFGLDEPPTSPVDMDSWDAINWGQMAATAGEDPSTLRIGVPDLNDFMDQPEIRWGTDIGNAAHIAWILTQNPALVAIHARNLLP